MNHVTRPASHFVVAVAEIATLGELPYGEEDDDEVIARLKHGRPPSFPSECAAGLEQVMRSCWRSNRAARPTAATVHAELLHAMQQATPSDAWLPANVLRDLSIEASMRSDAGDAAIDVVSAGFMRNFEQTQLRESDLTLQRELGRGAFGVVSLGLLMRASGSSVKVAVKSVDGGDPEEQQKAIVEAKLHFALQHSNIVAFVGYAMTADGMLTVLELMDGDLQRFLRKHRERDILTSEELRDMTVQVAGAMAFLEERRIVHRDLAARSGRFVSTIRLNSI